MMGTGIFCNEHPLLMSQDTDERSRAIGSSFLFQTVDCHQFQAMVVLC